MVVVGVGRRKGLERPTHPTSVTALNKAHLLLRSLKPSPLLTGHRLVGGLAGGSLASFSAAAFFGLGLPGCQHVQPHAPTDVRPSTLSGLLCVDLVRNVVAGAASMAGSGRNQEEAAIYLPRTLQLDAKFPRP
ncbi:hypothetical protein PG985_011172 [Apiospora marii]|uniref:uncharacterized protein n=1 Tax=Apiospora marii TaxID=335849 RepID=UPI00312F89E0